MKCCWPECCREAAQGEYCGNHYGLLIYTGIIKDPELDDLLTRTIQKAKVEAASRYPDNSLYKTWGKDQDDY